MQAKKTCNSIWAKMLMAMLSVALVFTMMPLTGGTVYADDADRTVFTIVDTDGTTKTYTKTQMEDFVKITDQPKVGSETITGGFAVKNILKSFNQDAIVTVGTADGYESHNNGMTVAEMRSAGYVLAFEIIDKNGNQKTLWDSVDSAGNSYDFYLYAPNGMEFFIG